MNQTKINSKYLINFLILHISLLMNNNLSGQATSNDGQWLKADFHIHTTMSDGDHIPSEIAHRAFVENALDIISITDHSGPYFKVDSNFQRLDDHGYPLKIQDYRILMKSDQKKFKNYSRSLTLIENSFPEVLQLRKQYPDKLITQGLEFNIPGHEHSCISIISDSVIPLSEFHYLFDRNDTLKHFHNLAKHNENTHQNALIALNYLQNKYRENSYFIVNHPSRKLQYTISEIRDFHNTAPDVVKGFEGFPGHQLKAERGGYNNSFGDQKLYHSKTYGGADYMLAKVGGLWDALLSEGRQFWIFADSDFHRPSEDGWPGEFAKNYIWMKEKSIDNLTTSLSAGKIFVVTGNLLSKLDFNIESENNITYMGGKLNVQKDSKLEINISLIENSLAYEKIDHVDLIVGDITGIVAPDNEFYNVPINESTKILKTFNFTDFREDFDGSKYVEFDYQLNKSQYFRLRGTNLSINVENETDKYGNPLCDELTAPNNSKKAFKDLWFYSNPIFVYTGNQ